MNRFRIFRRLVLAALTPGLLMGMSTVFGVDEGHPVAIRLWPGQGVTVETMWNLHAGIRVHPQPAGLPRSPNLDLRSGSSREGGPTSADHVHVWTDAGGREFVLDRKPNEAKPAWVRSGEAVARSENSVLVWHVPVKAVAEDGSPAVVLMIAVDGVRILDAGGLTAKSFLQAMQEGPAQVANLQSLDAVLVTAGGPDGESLQAIASLLHPRRIVIPAGETPPSVGDSPVRVVGHNTLAVSAAEGDPASTEYIALADTPWKMNDDLAGLYEKKETACHRSREVFSGLTVEQMNFVPGDGSHTPRWNAEHMMGRELGFFSQIYHGLEPAIPVMNLNPKQMPDQYRAAHPDWDGAEEARQMERVEAFNRRFAWLLDGIDPGARVPGNPFRSLRALLVQMERHYGEHTANVEKKMRLPQWPGGVGTDPATTSAAASAGPGRE